MGDLASPKILRGLQMSGTPIVLLSGGDLRQLLKPETTIKALRETYSALADNRGDQGRTVGFTVEGGSIHVKSGLLPGSHLAFALKVNVNLPDNWKLRQQFAMPRTATWCPRPSPACGHGRRRT